MDTEDPIDDTDLPLLSELIEGFMDHFQSKEASGVRMNVESVQATLPIELDLQGFDEDNMIIRASTPTQYTATSVMPVFHSISLKMEID